MDISKEDMYLAVKIAQSVKNAPAKSITKLAEKYLIGSEPNNNESSPCCEDPSACGK